MISLLSLSIPGMSDKMQSSLRHALITAGAVGLVTLGQYLLKIDFGTWNVIIDGAIAYGVRFVTTYVPESAPQDPQASNS